MRIYIAGPYTKGDEFVNVRNALLAADEIVAHGHIPFVPHLIHFWHLMFPQPYEKWLEIDLAWLPFCDALLRLPGASTGADGETSAALKLNIPVFSDIHNIVRWARSLA